MYPYIILTKCYSIIISSQKVFVEFVLYAWAENAGTNKHNFCVQGLYRPQWL